MRLKRSVLEKMKRHLEQTYPYEGCGVLLGKHDVITMIHEGNNIRKDRPEDRFLLDPSDILYAEKIGKQKGIDIIGFYHSHPDHPAKPSSTDLNDAWEDYYYLIISINKGNPADMSLFRFSGESNNFLQETLKIED